MGEAMMKKAPPWGGARRRPLPEILGYAKAEAVRTGKPRALVCNPDGPDGEPVYFHAAWEVWEQGTAAGPRCYLVERIDP